MIKRIIIVIVILIAGFVLLNGSYFWKQLKFVFHRNVPQQQTQTPAPVQPEMGEPNQINIPSLNITAPIQYVDEVNEDKFQEALTNGVVHYPGTADVGQLGNVYIFGHSSDFAFSKGHFKTVFALLPHIQKGAEIIVSDKNGQVFHYEVTDGFAVNNNQTDVLDQKGYTEKLLTLQTSYPVGTALRRWIVTAKLKE